MKAILIIDVDDNTDFDKAVADITMRDDEHGILLGNPGKKWIKGIKLKPMPTKREGNVQELVKQCCAIGFNACLEQLIEEDDGLDQTYEIVLAEERK